MKNVFVLVFFSIILFSCSSDNPTSSLTNDTTGIIDANLPKDTLDISQEQINDDLKRMSTLCMAFNETFINMNIDQVQLGKSMKTQADSLGKITAIDTTFFLLTGDTVSLSGSNKIFNESSKTTQASYVTSNDISSDVVISSTVFNGDYSLLGNITRDVSSINGSAQVKTALIADYNGALSYIDGFNIEYAKGHMDFVLLIILGNAMNIGVTGNINIPFFAKSKMYHGIFTSIISGNTDELENITYSSDVYYKTILVGSITLSQSGTKIIKDAKGNIIE